MSDISLTDYRSKLITKIMFSYSQEEVVRYIDAAIKSFDQKKINGHIISRFVDKILVELDLFSPMNKDAQQWSNIKMARIRFKQVKISLEATLKA